MNIKELNKEQIKTANNNSFGGTRGDTTEHTYKLYCSKVIEWKLSERKTQMILDKVYQWFSKILSLDSQHISVMVAGASNYNTKMDKGDKILQVSAEFSEWFKEIEEQATKKPYSRIEWLVKSIIWGVGGDYSVNKEWKELAGRSREDFEILYDELIKKYGEFKKTSIPYKIKHNLIDVEQITQAPIYADDDFCVFKEQNYLFIDYRLKPQRPLIVAMKSRGFVWISSYSMWRGNATENNIEWVKTISEKYEQYI